MRVRFRSGVFLIPLVLWGCEKGKGVVGPEVPVIEIRIPDDAVSTPIVYTGGESEEDVLDGVRELETHGITFSAQDREAMMAAFREYRVSEVEMSRPTTPPVQPMASYGAYTSHFVDWDLWLEYKWWAGSRQSYGLVTSDWAIYWIVQYYYGGHLLNWTWMEGSYQRVTMVAGARLWVPFGQGYLRTAIRVVT